MPGGVTWSTVLTGQALLWLWGWYGGDLSSSYCVGDAAYNASAIGVILGVYDLQ